MPAKKANKQKLKRPVGIRVEVYSNSMVAGKEPPLRSREFRGHMRHSEAEAYYWEERGDSHLPLRDNPLFHVCLHTIFEEVYV